MTIPADIAPQVEEMIERAVEAGVARALEQLGVKPLLKEKDVLRTLQVGRTKFINQIQPDLPPIWIGGSKRWDPDAVYAYIQKQADKP